MTAIQTMSIAALILVALVFDKCFGHPPIKLRKPNYCETCDDSCNKCEFGVTTLPSCGLVCAQGPDDVCGGPNDEWGICGDGMYCYCNKCHGCSAKGLKCKEAKPDDNCKIPHKHQRHILFP
ncbi:queen brain-selective protein-1 [Augochlora pura]